MMVRVGLAKGRVEVQAKGECLEEGAGRGRGKSGEHADEAGDNEMNEAYLGSACAGIIQAL